MQRRPPRNAVLAREATPALISAKARLYGKTKTISGDQILTREQCRLSLPDGVITYQIQRILRRSLSLKLDPQDGLVVQAPLNASPNRIRQLVEDNSAWIFKHQERWRRLGLPRPSHRYVSGERLFYLGQNYSLEIIPDYGAQRPAPRLWQDKLLLALPPELPENERPVWARQLLEQWFRRQTAAWLRTRTAFYAQTLHLDPPPVIARQQKTRWGSCSARGVLRFNLRLIMAPPHLIDYVAAHEVCHLREFNHSPLFWRLLTELLPDCRKRARSLREQGLLYTF